MPRVIETNLTEEDKKIEKTLRPQCLDDYIGQEKAKSTLKSFSTICFTITRLSAKKCRLR